MRCAVALLVILCSCGPRPSPNAGGAATTHFTSDSARADELARFRGDLPEVSSFSGGRPSADSLIVAFLTAISARDTATLRSLVISRSEFAWLYYPTARDARPPYDLDPATFWLLTSERGARGLAKALEALAGRKPAYVGYRCDPTPSREGANTVYGPCAVRLVQGSGDTVETRLFGLLIERDGVWKFVSYTNKLD